jgi:short-subunit dehydrogenase
MSKVVAIFGAGRGLGVALGRRFGREGFSVALIARRAERLDALVRELAVEGIEAAAFPADLSDAANARPVVDAVRSRFGRIDVVSYQPLPGGTTFTPAAELDSARLRALVELLLLTPVEIAHAVLPEMAVRGNGAFIVTVGFSAVEPQPHVSGLGPAMAGVHNFVHSLHGEIADNGIYAGVVALTGLIRGSEAHDAMTTDELTAVTGVDMRVLDPDELAEAYWRLYIKRDRIEFRFPETNAHKQPR